MESGNPPRPFLVRVGSKGLCFICLRDTTIVDQGNDRDSPESRLQNITRFLGIDTKAILGNYITRDLSKCEGVKVKLCLECSSVLENFSHLYQTLEVTRLKLNQCLDKIQELIDEADRDNVRVEEMKERVTHAPTARVMEEMRRRVLGRCLKAVRGAPRVIVERMSRSSKVPDNISPSPEEPVNFEEENEVKAGSSLAPDDDPVLAQPGPESTEEKSDAAPQPSMVLRPPRSPLVTKGPAKKLDIISATTAEVQGEDEVEEESNLVPEKATSDDDDNDEDPVWTPAEPESTDESSSEAESTEETGKPEPGFPEEASEPESAEESNEPPKPSKVKSKIKTQSCPHCKAVMRTSSTRYGTKLSAHLVRFHLDKFFEPEDKYKDKSLTSLQFKQVLYYLLFQNIVLKKGMAECPWCPKQFITDSGGSSGMVGLKIHLVRKHRDRLCKRLRELQTGPGLPLRLKEIRPGYHCKCGAYFANMYALRKHQNEFCSFEDKSVLKRVYLKREISFAKPSTCSLCGVEVPARNNKRLHVVSSHCEQYFADYRDPRIRVGAFKALIERKLFKDLKPKGNKRCCPYCPKEYKLERKTKVLKLHMVECHFGELVQKVRAIQRENSQKSIHNLRGSGRNCEEDEAPCASTTSILSCSHCKAVFELQRDLNRHLVIHHLETYFVPEANFKVESLTSQQFRKALHHLLFEELRTGTGSEVVRKKCPDCAKSFGKKEGWFADRKLHMILQHYTSLTQRLRELQMDPELPQKLKDITGDMICECGQYFERMWAYNVHRKRFCKLLKEGSQNDEGSTNLHLGHEEESGAPEETESTPPSQEQRSSPSPIPSEDKKGSSHEKSCPHCTAVIQSKRVSHVARDFESHLLYHHLETFFLPEEEFKEPSLTSFQFKQVLEHSLFANIQWTSSAKMRGAAQKCPHCPRMFPFQIKKAPIELKRHLIKHHHERLSQRLKELQKDPRRLLEKLGRAKGFLCRCGAYFASGQVYYSHQRRFCSSRTTSNGEEGTTDVIGNTAGHSTGLEVGDDDDEHEDECCLFLPQDSESEHGRDPLALEYENKCKVEDEVEPEPEGTDLKSVGIDIEEFVFVVKIEEEPPPLVKTERKRGSSELMPESECLPEKVAKLENE